MLLARHADVESTIATSGRSIKTSDCLTSTDNATDDDNDINGFGDIVVEATLRRSESTSALRPPLKDAFNTPRSNPP